jgi:hypothetical protein
MCVLQAAIINQESLCPVTENLTGLRKPVRFSLAVVLSRILTKSISTGGLLGD